MNLSEARMILSGPLKFGDEKQIEALKTLEKYNADMQPNQCTRCGGSGQMTCGACDGYGRIECGACDGSGDAGRPK